ncbi:MULTISPECIES: carboxypeptidase-like regulatory domain-containing protein [unclassified Polaribacter]|uniref:carboxypeptidase-like regulatory domain-containing protein n=1 Tax=unclassified Polaribacter TaxID=196858 RepID=UPI0011BFB3A4|nr:MULTISPECIES: carboxypeptidase-like regulatory domain-containing protein [unclassified Polaribacter]TXD52140.1 carboxypeptidase-like regulatory domain-containing protein [Polaribacter sp. IC063]TXD59994.1 carboxypeptidase-like regulatory domain-containing protein [Polaribacter sp. IC066]
MKKITLFTLLFFSLAIFSQSKEFVLIDAISKEPIDLAQISYPELEIGSISNKDGSIRIPLRENDIFISHINYNEKTLSYKVFSKKDTLFLSPKENQLDEIVISNVDLKAKISDILKNTYLEKYSTKKAINKSTYKEVFRVNDSLNRLFQVQLDWWSKDGLFRGNKPIDKQNKIVVESVDYSKIKKIESDFISANGAFVPNENLFPFFHLNFLLSIFNQYSSDVVVKSIDKQKKSIHIYFDATYASTEKIMYHHKNSLLVFDTDYSAISYVKFNMLYVSDFENAISRIDKIPHQKKTTKHSVELSFKKLKNNKLRLNYFISEMEGVIKAKNFTDTISSKQSLFISESILGKKIRRGNIDFYKPFHENLPPDLKTSNIKILLTKEEKEFLNIR